MHPSTFLPVLFLTASMASAAKPFSGSSLHAQAPLDLDLNYADALNALDTNPSHDLQEVHQSSSSIPDSSAPTASLPLPRHRRPMTRRKVAPVDPEAQNGAARARKIVGATALGILIFVVF